MVVVGSIHRLWVGWGDFVNIMFPVCLRSSTQTDVMQSRPGVGIMKVWVAQCPGRERTAKYIGRNQSWA